MTAAMPEPTPNYAHRASYVPPAPRERYDGDSFRLALDLGAYVGGAIRQTLIVAIRLEGIDVVEYSDNRPDPRSRAPIPVAIGRGAAAFTMSQLATAGRITVQTVKPDGVTALGGTFERTRAHVWVDGLDLADLLRDAGYEKPPKP